MANERPARGASCLLTGLGVVIGLIVGVALALTLGDAIGQALAISTFEGERGYFVVFLLAPAFAVVGAIIGGVGLSYWAHHRRASVTSEESMS